MVCGCLAGCGGGGAPVRSGVGRDHVVGAVPRPLADVEARLAAAGEGALREVPKFRRLQWARAGDPIAPPADQLTLAAGTDPALAAYAALPASAREHDFYVFDLADAYWESGEYTWGGRPAPFKSDFFVHLQAAGTNVTSMEVIEYRPRVRLGERFLLLGHHGPGYYHDIRFVPPTTEDREALLTALQRLFLPPPPTQT